MVSIHPLYQKPFYKSNVTLLDREFLVKVQLQLLMVSPHFKQFYFYESDEHTGLYDIPNSYLIGRRDTKVYLPFNFDPNCLKMNLQLAFSELCMGFWKNYGWHINADIYINGLVVYLKN